MSWDISKDERAVFVTLQSAGQLESASDGVIAASWTARNMPGRSAAARNDRLWHEGTYHHALSMDLNGNAITVS